MTIQELAQNIVSKMTTKTGMNQSTSKTITIADIKLYMKHYSIRATKNNISAVVESIKTELTNYINKQTLHLYELSTFSDSITFTYKGFK